MPIMAQDAVLLFSFPWEPGILRIVQVLAIDKAHNDPIHGVYAILSYHIVLKIGA